MDMSEVRLQKYIYTKGMWEDITILVYSKKIGKWSLLNDYRCKMNFSKSHHRQHLVCKEVDAQSSLAMVQYHYNIHNVFL
jgi:hypothetical protein